jgi:hypothetical protein
MRERFARRPTRWPPNPRRRWFICLPHLFIDVFDRVYPAELPPGAAWISSLVTNLADQLDAWSNFENVHALIGQGEGDEVRGQADIAIVRSVFEQLRAHSTHRASTVELEHVIGIIDEALSTGSPIYLEM